MNSPRLHFYPTAPEITAFSTTRHGGVSTGNHGEFNINEYCGDTPEHTAANRKALAATLSLPESRIVMPHQTHGTSQRIIGNEFFSLPGNIQKMQLEDVDCILTNVPGICVGVSTADCIPVLLHDAAHNAVAAVHAGWRGTAKSVVTRAVSKMHTAFHTCPEELTAIIGPGISQKNFEVGDEVYDAFAEARMPMPYIAQHLEKWHIDLPLCNKMQLMAAGVKEENILMSGICTYDNTADYFSARRLGTKSGRIFSGIFMRP